MASIRPFLPNYLFGELFSEMTTLNMSKLNNIKLLLWPQLNSYRPMRNFIARSCFSLAKKWKQTDKHTDTDSYIDRLAA